MKKLFINKEDMVPGNIYAISYNVGEAIDVLLFLNFNKKKHYHTHRCMDLYSYIPNMGKYYVDELGYIDDWDLSCEDVKNIWQLT